MDRKVIEQFYEHVILPNYHKLDAATIRWKDHGRIGPDAWVHYFEDTRSREYVIVFEDFPGDTFLDDRLTHEVVPLDGETSIEFGVKSKEHAQYVLNITGYFTLYRKR